MWFTVAHSKFTHTRFPKCHAVGDVDFSDRNKTVARPENSTADALPWYMAGIYHARAGTVKYGKKEYPRSWSSAYVVCLFCDRAASVAIQKPPFSRTRDDHSRSAYEFTCVTVVITSWDWYWNEIFEIRIFLLLRTLVFFPNSVENNNKLLFMSHNIDLIVILFPNCLQYDLKHILLFWNLKIILWVVIKMIIILYFNSILIT